jgi:hypothetical protein
MFRLTVSWRPLSWHLRSWWTFNIIKPCKGWVHLWFGPCVSLFCPAKCWSFSDHGLTSHMAWFGDCRRWRPVSVYRLRRHSAHGNKAGQVSLRSWRQTATCLRTSTIISVPVANKVRNITVKFVESSIIVKYPTCRLSFTWGEIFWSVVEMTNNMHSFIPYSGSYMFRQ